MNDVLGGIIGLSAGAALLIAFHAIRWRIEFGDWKFLERQWKDNP